MTGTLSGPIRAGSAAGRAARKRRNFSGFRFSRWASRSSAGFVARLRRDARRRERRRISWGGTRSFPDSCRFHSWTGKSENNYLLLKEQPIVNLQRKDDILRIIWFFIQTLAKRRWKLFVLALNICIRAKWWKLDLFWLTDQVSNFLQSLFKLFKSKNIFTWDVHFIAKSSSLKLKLNSGNYSI